MKNENYFTILLIFVTILELTALFNIIHDPTILFHLTFSSIYNSFSDKFSVSAK